MAQFLIRGNDLNDYVFNTATAEKDKQLVRQDIAQELNMHDAIKFRQEV